MSNEKQNSIDWLIEQFEKTFGNGIYLLMNNSIKKAKEMHRKELDLAYQDGKEIEHIQNTIEKNKHKHTEVTNDKN
jgi:hypothetical protein